MEALAIKYRPQTFEEVCSQKSIIKILKKQISTKTFKNCYLFAGASGTGKTTCARLLADAINNHKGSPIEIDGASNNGVDNVRNIIDDANERAIDAEYKVYIIDEAHMITTAGWNAFLKMVEEPPKYTIFIFCTTDPQKIPETIINRTQRYNFTKVSTEEIENRLRYICEQEKFTNYEESIAYLSKVSFGCVRQAITLLDKVAAYSTDVNINNVLMVLGDFSYENLFTLTNSIIDGDEKVVLSILDNAYNSGYDLKQFVEQYLDFVLDLTKYCLFKDMSILKIPHSMEEKVKYCTNIENNTSYFNKLLDKVLEIKNRIRYDANMKTTVSIMLIQATRGV